MIVFVRMLGSLLYNQPPCNTYNKQLLDEVFVICEIIKVEVSVISRAEGEVETWFPVQIRG